MIVHCLEQGTCGYRAAEEFALRMGMAVQLCPHRSFQEAVEHARSSGSSDVALIPHIHPVAQQISLDAELFVQPGQVIAVPNPPLFLAGTQAGLTAGASCASIPTLQRLLPPEVRAQLHFVEALTTQHAARLVVQGECDVCVTNESGVERHGLIPLCPLKHIVVAWMAFGARLQTNEEKRAW